MAGQLRLVAAVFVALMAATGLRAQSPEDTVRWIYASLDQPGGGIRALASPAQRDQFLSKRLSAFFAANDASGGTCLGFGLEVPGNDFEIAEILRTLSLTAQGDQPRKSVSAQFTNFGQPAQVVYDFIVEDGFWKIDDIAGSGWRISQIPCSARPAATAGGFCYLNGSDSLRLNLPGDGSAMIDVISWQGNGHSCSVTGRAGAIEGGWLLHAEQGCRLQVLVTADQGIRFVDTDWACKPMLCGQRAVIDGLSFPRSSQIDCSQLPVN